jgi:RNA polymerase sigma-70 factor (ECF subfamily)
MARESDQKGGPPGWPESVADMWVRHRRWVAAVCLANLPPGADLDDVVQEVALTFVKKAGSIQDPAAIPAWLRAVAINVARMSARNGGRRRQIEGPWDEKGAAKSVSAGTEPARRVEDQDALAQAARLLSGLPAELREVLLLRCVDGLTQKEIADLVGVPETTVETRLARARRFLRERMETVWERKGANA